jgi:hypothetical protein
MSKRWIIKRTYVSAFLDIVEAQEIQEIAEAHDLIERGHDWRMLKSIEITPNPAWFEQFG